MNLGLRKNWQNLYRVALKTVDFLTFELLKPVLGTFFQMYRLLHTKKCADCGVRKKTEPPRLTAKRLLRYTKKNECYLFFMN